MCTPLPPLAGFMAGVGRAGGLARRPEGSRRRGRTQTCGLGSPSPAGRLDTTLPVTVPARAVLRSRPALPPVCGGRSRGSESPSESRGAVPARPAQHRWASPSLRRPGRRGPSGAGRRVGHGAGEPNRAPDPAAPSYRRRWAGGDAADRLRRGGALLLPVKLIAFHAYANQHYLIQMLPKFGFYMSGISAISIRKGKRSRKKRKKRQCLF